MELLGGSASLGLLGFQPKEGALGVLLFFGLFTPSLRTRLRSSHSHPSTGHRCSQVTKSWNSRIVSSSLLNREPPPLGTEDREQCRGGGAWSFGET